MEDIDMGPKLYKHLRSHKAAVTGISYHPSEEQVATCSLDQSAFIWNLKKSIRGLKLEGHGGIVNSIAWSPDGNTVATASSDRIVRLWAPSVKSNHCVEFRAHTSSVRSVCFDSESRKLLTASDDKSIKLWRVNNKKFITSFTGHTNWVRCAKFSPNDDLIASCAEDKTVKLFDPRSGLCTHTFSDDKGFGTNLAWHKDNNVIAVAMNNNRVKIYDIKVKKIVQYYRCYSGTVNSLDFHPSGNYLITGSDDGLKILDMLEGRPVFVLKGHEGPVKAVQFSKDGQTFASAGADGHLMLWTSGLTLCAKDSPGGEDMSLTGGGCSGQMLDDEDDENYKEPQNTSIVVDPLQDGSYNQSAAYEVSDDDD